MTTGLALSLGQTAAYGFNLGFSGQARLVYEAVVWGGTTTSTDHRIDGSTEASNGGRPDKRKGCNPALAHPALGDSGSASARSPLPCSCPSVSLLRQHVRWSAGMDLARVGLVFSPYLTTSTVCCVGSVENPTFRLYSGYTQM
ncbi:hypothetical protein LX32DRAFT_17087 [Colletotrichum zoysiae]|uniref:Uncharacterized protein n=1 Tax=Colletotrichum zoysiae TaxID=1216348 RepID=A0AAD9HEC6_9PEZI|nr:hypothetical protein LX32DRAFT_17087 [Colletotrichum zoysiae]